ncbi:MAG: hypothetical protein CVU09_10980 [Bacteroidetes bacterium HGW-Bacteroidetes-4]|jgi:uncharacterized membrane protein|nr:MAG: hypothetical protein CVU09_10980 [Bacteroidetes bacterium HGW-Bacteroidetes-4]
MELKYIILLLFFILTPIAVIYIEKRYDIVKKVGAVLLCYAIGLLIGNLNMLPDGVQRYQELLSNLTIPLALPLILFSINVKRWFTYARETMVSLLIGLFTVILMVAVGFYMFGDDIPDAWKVSGMLVGIYTGGTPNLAAMKTALNVEHELYIMTHTYELVFGAIYLVFILSIGQKVFLKFLPPFKKAEVDSAVLNGEVEDEFGSYEGIGTRKVIWPLMGAFGLSVAIVGISVLLSKLFPKDFETAAIILLITTISIGFSFIPRINQIKKTFQGGMYLILIFCLVVASMADVSQLANISFSLFWYVGLAMFGSHILHAFIAKFFKIDADTVIISGSALICSPPFVPVVAGALKNKEVILSGLIIGIAGYAIGNYLGVFMAYLLK